MGTFERDIVTVVQDSIEMFGPTRLVSVFVPTYKHASPSIFALKDIEVLEVMLSQNRAVLENENGFRTTVVRVITPRSCQPSIHYPNGEVIVGDCDFLRENIEMLSALNPTDIVYVGLD